MCLHSGVRDVRPPSIIRWQRGLRIIFQAQRTYICLTDGSFTNYAETTACSLDGSESFLLWGFVWLHSSLQGHTCMYVKKPQTLQKLNVRWSRSVECWPKRAPLSICVHHHTGVVSERSTFTCQPAPFKADLQSDLQLTSREAGIAPLGMWLLEILQVCWKSK